ncbi:MAG: ribonuclease HI family protein [Chloroflexi bacterium]|nr:ribonuclease HI family protein [Chloroflexota bacterium]
MTGEATQRQSEATKCKQNRKKRNLKVERAIIFTDGASRGNPGPAAIGVLIRDEQGRLMATVSQAIGTATNNQAEYRAMIAALEKAIGLGVRQVEVYSDSELLVKQINGQYRVKNESLKSLYQRVKLLQGQLDAFTLKYVPREQNREADRLANNALA